MNFTFSDFQWIFEDIWANAKMDTTVKDRFPFSPSDKVIIGDRFFGKDRFIKKWLWQYEPELPNVTVNLPDSKYVDSGYIHNFSEQKNYPNNLKSISLIKNQRDLKQALRLDDQSREKYLKYFKGQEEYFHPSLKNRKVSEEELSKKYFPWTDTFNFDTINSKMDFENYDYLFVKDLRSTYGDGTLGIGDLSKGIKIKYFEIEPESHKLTILFTYEEEVNPCENCLLDELAEHYWSWKRLSSMLVPIEKNKISEFNMNDWDLEILGYFYIPHGRI
ncbi:hypothetical protein [Mycoplasmopsis agassizii]|nr:hypothetical protein [Mycoplasmopsis agassizii]SMC17629.1 hypothetical protein SAMN02745179_00511 [Mycoplasmopsis agassizii]